MKSGSIHRLELRLGVPAVSQLVHRAIQEKLLRSLRIEIHRESI